MFFAQKLNGVLFDMWKYCLVVGIFVCPSAVLAESGHVVHHKGKRLEHIATQAQAEALKPGDSIAMACSMCKNVSIYQVTKGENHVELMTIGKKHTCPVCGGTVTVVGNGKGTGKNEEVKHVCSKCGDGAMFVAASTSSATMDH